MPIKNGDKNAFKELFNLMYKPLLHHIYKLTGQREMSQESTNDIFVSLWKNRKKVTINVSLKAYLYRAATNKTYDYYRKKEREERTLPLDNQTIFSPMESDTDLNYSETEKIVLECLEQLPERCRMVFSLSRLSGYANKKIAQELTIALKTVENQLNKGLKYMRDCVLKKNPIFK